MLTTDRGAGVPSPLPRRWISALLIPALAVAGFTRESAMLRHFANFRSTDNWWNQYLGHHDAYAATNFPLGVLTLYEPFFRTTVDDNERAVILLHEAQHLIGAGEDGGSDDTSPFY